MRKIFCALILVLGFAACSFGAAILVNQPAYNSMSFYVYKPENARLPSDVYATYDDYLVYRNSRGVWCYASAEENGAERTNYVVGSVVPSVANIKPFKPETSSVAPVLNTDRAPAPAPRINVISRSVQAPVLPVTSGSRIVELPARPAIPQNITLPSIPGNSRGIPVGPVPGVSIPGRAPGNSGVLSVPEAQPAPATQAVPSAPSSPAVLPVPSAPSSPAVLPVPSVPSNPAVLPVPSVSNNTAPTAPSSPRTPAVQPRPQVPEVLPQSETEPKHARVVYMPPSSGLESNSGTYIYAGNVTDDWTQNQNFMAISKWQKSVDRIGVIDSPAIPVAWKGNNPEVIYAWTGLQWQQIVPRGQRTNAAGTLRRELYRLTVHTNRVNLLHWTNDDTHVLSQYAAMWGYEWLGQIILGRTF